MANPINAKLVTSVLRRFTVEGKITMTYPHSIPLCRPNGEILPANNAISRVVLSSVGTKWNDVVVEQHHFPSGELTDVMYKRHVIAINIGHSFTNELEKDGRI